MPEIRSLFAAVVAVLPRRALGLCHERAVLGVLQRSGHRGLLQLRQRRRLAPGDGRLPDYLRSIDPCQHLITTSFADSTRCLTP